MGLKRIVYNAARDGEIYELKHILDHRPTHQVVKLLSPRKDKSTPLIEACINGHLAVAEYLLEKCHADVEQVGSVMFKYKIYEGVSPLWCAAIAGHLKLVKTLVGKYNASVNTENTTAIDTPLLAACHEDCVSGRFEITKYLIEHGADIDVAKRHGFTCLMIASLRGQYEFLKYLLQCGADVNRKDIFGRTASHFCARLGHLDILKLLLKHGARNDTDKVGETPLLYAATAGTESVVDYISDFFNCTKEEKVDAFELLGATFVDDKRCLTSARKYWRRAMELRYDNSALPFQNLDADYPISSYVKIREIRSYDELEALTDDEMNIQALVVRERVLGPGNPTSIRYIRSRGTLYAENDNFEICNRLWMYVLDVEQNRRPPSLVYEICLLNSTRLFYRMLSKTWNVSKDFSTITFHQIFLVYENALRTIETTLNGPQIQGQNAINIHRHDILSITMHLLNLMCKLRPYLNENETVALKTAAYKFVHMNPKGKNGFTPLHLASSKGSLLSDSSSYLPSIDGLSMFAFPSVGVVNLLLEVGACPNAVDLRNNTPLHIAAMNLPCAADVFKSLLSLGSHLDLCNKKNQTPLQLAHDTPQLVLYPLQHLNLQCLCAQTINMYKIPYEGLVHEKLFDFLNAHCSH